jgi:hypothetical protein
MGRRIDREAEQPMAPNPCPEHVDGMRSFSLNSDEAYAALCPREDRPWIPNGALPREPRVREREVIVEVRGISPSPPRGRGRNGAQRQVGEGAGR